MKGLDFFEQRGKSVPKEVIEKIDKSLEIAEQIAVYLERKKWTQKMLAQKMGKSEAEISKYLSGFHNFTLETIGKISAALGEEIITTPYRAGIMQTLPVVSEIQGLQLSYLSSHEICKVNFKKDNLLEMAKINVQSESFALGA